MSHVDEYKKEMTTILKGLARKSHIREVFKDFIEMSAIALYNVYSLNQELEERFSKIREKYTAEEYKKFSALLGFTFMGIKAAKKSNYTDFLGEIYMGLELGDTSKDQYFTPLSVAGLLTDLALSDQSIDAKLAKKPFVSILEPTCGSGVNIISFAQKIARAGYDINRKMCAVGVDLDLTCVLMCYIQCELYGIPAKILHGDSLANKYETAWRTSEWCIHGFERKISSEIIETKVEEVIDIKPLLTSVNEIGNCHEIISLEQLSLF